ncbi:MAG: alpha/beta fold hydrolase [Sneathiellales bacterium]|nr:alpha/beta fold hydrolase [Sneathiellales bacterium]
MIVTINSIEFHVEFDGPEDAPVVILSHSLATNLNAWDRTVPALVKDFRVLRYSMRGHGKTSAPESPYSLSDLASDIAAIMDHFNIEKAHLVGLSIGGMIAQTFALEHADRLNRLVVSSSLCELPEGGEALWVERIRDGEKSGIEAMVEPTIERWFIEETRSSDPDLLDFTRGLIRETELKGYIGCCHGISKLALKERLPHVKAETLVIVGDQDMGTPVAASEVIASQIPGAKLTVIEQASHQAALEQPEAFNSAILAFLKGE